MANEQNLKKFGKDKPPLTHEEAVKQGKTGGKASGEARAKAKTSREIVELLDSLPVTENNNAIMETLGIPEDMRTRQTLRLLQLQKKAEQGDAQAKGRRSNDIRPSDMDGQNAGDIRRRRTGHSLMRGNGYK